MEEFFEVEHDGGTVCYPPLGSCLYCGATSYRPGRETKLADEHIIPEGLGGTLVLPQASCASCATVTSQLERSVLKGPLHAARIHQKIRRKPKSRPPEKFTILVQRGGREEEIEVPWEKYPVMLNIFGLGSPGILVGHDGTDRSGQFLFCKSLNFTPTNFFEMEISPFQLPLGNLYHFWRFLAKIAHGFLICRLGLDNFEALLPEFILDESNRPEHYFYLVGCEQNGLPPTDCLHQLRIEDRNANASSYLVVLIRLFANLGTPTFCVVAGKT